MKKSAIRAVLQARPWLWKSIGHITGTHAYDVKQSGEKWESHLETWADRNISEISVRPFEELNVNEKAEFVRTPLGQPDEKVSSVTGDGYKLRTQEAFTHTEYFVFNHSTYEEEWSLPFAFCWTTSSIHGEGAPKTVKESLHHMRRPSYLLGTNEKIETPYVLDAIVRITKVGVVGRCSSTIIDVFLPPEDFNTTSL